MNDEQPVGRPDAGSFRVTYGPPERDYAAQRTRWRRYWAWTEGGKRCGSWTWQDEPPTERRR